MEPLNKNGSWGMMASLDLQAEESRELVGWVLHKIKVLFIGVFFFFFPGLVSLHSLETDTGHGSHTQPGFFSTALQ